VTGRSPLPILTTSKPLRSLRQGLFAGTTIGDATSGGYFINLALTFVGISTVDTGGGGGQPGRATPRLTVGFASAPPLAPICSHARFPVRPSRPGS
jgi:hypothetical protein